MKNSVEQFRKDWSQDAAVAQLCSRLVDFLTTSGNKLEHFSFSQLKSAVEPTNDVDLTKALQYLSSPRCRVLAQVFLFFDDDQVYEFGAAEMVEVYNEAKFAHPRTGQVITDLNQIAVAFEVGQYLKEMVNS